MQSSRLLFLITLALLPTWVLAQGEDGTKEKILAVFHPYRQGSARVEGITPGMRIDKSNFQVAQEVVPPEILKYVQAGDFAITVQETTDMPLREEYVRGHGRGQPGAYT